VLDGGDTGESPWPATVTDASTACLWRVWNVGGGVVGGGVQTSCWVLRQPALLCGGWFGGSLPAWIPLTWRWTWRWLVCAVAVVGLVLVENCTVDASIFKFVVIAQVFLRCRF
jgi:hypothetical protein